jgi:hypothetical protein
MTIRANDIETALAGVGQKWTRQVKSEEKRPSSRARRAAMWTQRHRSLKDICFEKMEEAWLKASGEGRLPTAQRQHYYVMRPLVEEHPEAEKPLEYAYFTKLLEEYREEYAPCWDVLKAERGMFKEPHAARNANGLGLGTMNVRNYLRGAGPCAADIELVESRFPTNGAANRFGAVLICEKEGFDELLEAEHVPERFDIALMSTKGVSVFAARDLAQGLGVRCYTLHDLDKNGFVMAAGFPDAIDLGIRLTDVKKWKDLVSEPQTHSDPEQTYRNE